MDLEHALDSIHKDSINTPELDVSLDEVDAIPSSVSSAYLCLVSTLSDTFRLQLTPSIKSHKLNCQARALLFPVLQAAKMSASQFIHYLSSHPAAFAFQASLPTDNITLNPGNKGTDQSLLDFQTRIGAATYATLDTEQLSSHTRTALVDTIASLWGSASGVIAALEVHDLLTKIHDILDNAV